MKNILVAVIIEAVIFLLPFIKLWVNVGAWKKEVEEKLKYNSIQIDTLNANISSLNANVSKISEKLIEISTKVGLLLDSKIRLDDDK